MQHQGLPKEFSHVQKTKMHHMKSNSISGRAAKSISKKCEMEQVDIPIYLYEIVYKYKGIWGCGQPKNILAEITILDQ